MKNIKRLILVVLVIGVIIFGFSMINVFKVKERTNTLSSNIEENIEELIEITTSKYNYTNLVEYDNNLEISGLTIPFTSKTFLVKYSGYLKAGFTDLDVEVKSPKTAVVTFGEFKILDNVISEEETYFYNQKDSAFNRFKYDELYELLKEEKVKVEKEALDNGFLNDSRNSAEKTIGSFLKTLGFEEIIFN